MMTEYDYYSDTPPNSVRSDFTVVELEDYESSEDYISDPIENINNTEKKDTINKKDDIVMIDIANGGYTPPEYNNQAKNNICSIKSSVFSCCIGYLIGLGTICILIYLLMKFNKLC